MMKKMLQLTNSFNGSSWHIHFLQAKTKLTNFKTYGPNIYIHHCMPIQVLGKQWTSQSVFCKLKITPQGNLSFYQPNPKPSVLVTLSSV